ncbi:MAG: ATP-dependent RNA helicase RhlE, partial [Bacteroidia bacterium]
VPEDYVHRIGRTARAGQEGNAISLVCVDELKLLKDIERLLRIDIEKVHLTGYDVDPSIKAEPIRNGGGGGRNNSGGRGKSQGRGQARASSGRPSGGAGNNRPRARVSSGNR